MEILLATPINKTHYCVPPLGLAYLASALRRENFRSLSILDSVKESLDYDKFSLFLERNKPAILGIQCYSLDVPSVNRMLAIAKRIDPHIVTVVGGPHPTAVPEAVFSEFDNLDFAIRGEAERSMISFVRAVLARKKSFSDIPGVVFRNDGKVVTNSPEFINDLDSLGMPAWDLIDPRDYPDEVQGAFYNRFPVAPLITSRGCPHECTFCANNIMLGRVVRFRDIGKVVDEMEYLTLNYNVKEFHILDDNFTINRKRVLDFCRLVRERKMKTSIAFPNGVRLDTLDEKVLSALKEAGAYSITVGIESGSQRILNHMKKRLTLNLIRERIGLIKKIGFSINAFFIIGYPEETKEDIMDTIRFAKELPIDVAHFSSFLPLPGTAITEELLHSGRLKEINYEELFYSKTPFSPEGITKKELKTLQKKAFLSFYLRPSIIIRLVLRLKSLRHLLSIFRRTVDYVFIKRGS